MNKAKEYKDLTVEELDVAMLDLRKELYLLRNDRRSNSKIDQPHQFRSNRKDIARILTVLREKQLAS